MTLLRGPMNRIDGARDEFTDVLAAGNGDNLLVVCRLFVAIVFGLAVVGKLSVGLTPLLIPVVALEFSLGLCMALGVWLKPVGILVAAAGLIFILINVQSAISGNDFCECFGRFEVPIGFSILFDAALVCCGSLVAQKSALARTNSSRTRTLSTVFVFIGSLVGMLFLFFIVSVFAAKSFEEKLVGTSVPENLERHMFGSQSVVHCPPEYAIFILDPACPSCSELSKKVHAERVRRDRRDETPIIVVYAMRPRNIGPGMPLITAEGALRDSGGNHELMMANQELFAFWPQVRFPSAALLVVSNRVVREVHTGKSIEKRLFSELEDLE